MNAIVIDALQLHVPPPPQGQYLGVGTQAGTIQIWDAVAEKRVTSLSRHTGRVGETVSHRVFSLYTCCLSPPSLSFLSVLSHPVCDCSPALFVPPSLPPSLLPLPPSLLPSLPLSFPSLPLSFPSLPLSFPLLPPLLLPLPPSLDSSLTPSSYTLLTCFWLFMALFLPPSLTHSLTSSLTPSLPHSHSLTHSFPLLLSRPCIFIE